MKLLVPLLPAVAGGGSRSRGPIQEKVYVRKNAFLWQMVTAEVKQQLRQLKSDVEGLLTDYRHAKGDYRQSRDIAPIAGEIVGRIFDAPASKVEKVFTPKGWKLTPAYSALEGRFKNLFERSRSFLDSVAKQTARGYRRGLAGSLRPVTQAVRLETKIGKLLGMLQGHEMDELVFIWDIPKSKRKTVRRPRPRRDTNTETVTWTLIGVFATIATAFVLALSPSLGFLALPLGVVLAGLLFLALLRTRRFWIPRFRKVLERR